MPTITVPAAAVATAAGGAFTADQIFEPDAAAAAASGPTPAVNPPVTITVPAAVATATAPWISFYGIDPGDYSYSLYGSGYYGGSQLVMSILDYTWDIAYTTDDASDTTPTWTTVATADIRSVDVARGREDELGRVEAGTAQLTLNNRTRSFDPQVVTGLRPMNRWRLRLIHNAVTYNVFLGYAESYEQSWPGVGYDAITVVRLVDEFKVLALAKLPAMDPPTAQSYADVVMFDEPAVYWRMQGLTETVAQGFYEPVVGSHKLTTGSFSRATSPIVGDASVDVVGGVLYGARSTTTMFYTFNDDDLLAGGIDAASPLNADGLSQLTVEMWFKSSEATPAAGRKIAEGPDASTGGAQWGLNLETTGAITAYVHNTTPTLFSATSSAGAVTANTWYHLALVLTSGNLFLFINGAQAALTGSVTGVIGPIAAGEHMQFGTDTAVGGTRYYDEMAFYRHGLTAARVAAHYTAGANRGFPTQDPGARITAVLAASTSVASSSVRAGSREMIPAFMAGQSPLDELRKAEDADNVDSMLFVSSNGTVTFLDDGHRSVSPWNTVQATFDDDGTDLPYRDLTVDYSETFLFNTIQAARVSGEISSSTDATSVSRYRERMLQATDLPLTTDSDVSAIATALLAKYKDPMTRITSIGIYLISTAMIAAVLDLELADRVRIYRTHPAGGARIDQTAFVQKIQMSSRPGLPLQVTLGVSPL
jgi:hypothetical protein